MYQDVTRRLEQFIDNHLPLATGMGVKIEHYDGAEFTLSAPLALNHNDKGTGFGGSLYCLCLTNAIGLMFLKCFEQGLDPDLVVGEANIKYLQPVASELITSCCRSPGDGPWREFFQRYRDCGKASLLLQATIVRDGRPAVWFEGRFAIIGEAPTSGAGQ